MCWWTAGYLHRSQLSCRRAESRRAADLCPQPLRRTSLIESSLNCDDIQMDSFGVFALYPTARRGWTDATH